MAAVVQTVVGTEAATATTIPSGAINTTAGNAISVAVLEQNTTDVSTSVTDTGSNTYVQTALGGTISATNITMTHWHTNAASPASTGAAGVVTAHFSSAIAAVIIVQEISGANNTSFVDTSRALAQATGAAYNSGTATAASVANELCLGFCAYAHSGSARTNTTAAAFTQGAPSGSNPSTTGFNNSTDGAAHTSGLEADWLVITSVTAQQLTATLSNATTSDGAFIVFVTNAATGPPGTGYVRRSIGRTVTTAARTFLARARTVPPIPARLQRSIGRTTITPARSRITVAEPPPGIHPPPRTSSIGRMTVTAAHSRVTVAEPPPSNPGPALRVRSSVGRMTVTAARSVFPFVQRLPPPATPPSRPAPMLRTIATPTRTAGRSTVSTPPRGPQPPPPGSILRWVGDFHGGPHAPNTRTDQSQP